MSIFREPERKVGRSLGEVRIDGLRGKGGFETDHVSERASLAGRGRARKVDITANAKQFRF